MTVDATMIATKNSDRFAFDDGYDTKGQQVISDETMLLDMTQIKSAHHSSNRSKD